jgi:hypothetical protein
MWVCAIVAEEKRRILTINIFRAVSLALQNY